MKRLLFLLAAMVAVLAAPLAAPALAAATPMEHCAEGHQSPPTGDHESMALDHQACCAAVDPGKMSAMSEAVFMRPLAIRPLVDLIAASMASGTDPPPPRLD